MSLQQVKQSGLRFRRVGSVISAKVRNETGDGRIIAVGRLAHKVYPGSVVNRLPIKHICPIYRGRVTVSISPFERVLTRSWWLAPGSPIGRG